jgi:hypothetical protein
MLQFQFQQDFIEIQKIRTALKIKYFDKLASDVQTKNVKSETLFMNMKQTQETTDVQFTRYAQEVSNLQNFTESDVGKSYLASLDDNTSSMVQRVSTDIESDYERVKKFQNTSELIVTMQTLLGHGTKKQGCK